MTHEFTWLKANQLLKIYLILQKIPPQKIQNEPSEMASLSCVKWGAASVTSDRCWFHSALFFYLSVVNFLGFYGFTVTLRTSVRFEPWKLKANKKLYSHLFYKKGSNI